MRYATVWALFSIGHVISRVMSQGRGYADWLYPAYNRVMILSSDIQGDGRGPWGDIVTAEEDSE